MGLYPLQALNQPHAGGLHILGWGPFPTQPMEQGISCQPACLGNPAELGVSIT